MAQRSRELRCTEALCAESLQEPPIAVPSDIAMSQRQFVS
tara:strand:+ start:218 stop:337 length:120 start_codon:yes stop_codon:yes gene_type:complete